MVELREGVNESQTDVGTVTPKLDEGSLEKTERRVGGGSLKNCCVLKDK